MSKYQFQLSDQNQNAWDEKVDASPEGTIFHKLQFLDAYKDLFPIKKYDIKMGEQKKGSLIFNVSPLDSKKSIFAPGVIHNGFFLNQDFVDSPHASRRNSASFDITTDLVEFMSKEYNQISLRLSPQLIDMRPFLWFNYSSQNPSDKFKVSIRYTSYLSIENCHKHTNLAENPLFAALSESRRQEVRYAIKDNIHFYEEADIDGFLSLYKEMAQGYDPDIDKFIPTLKNCLQSLLKKNSLKIFFVNDKNNKKAAASVFGIDAKRAYYLYGATSRGDRDRYSGSYILWKALESLSSSGINNVDFEGINSPRRGWFKLSFGGSILPYYQVEWSSGSLT